MKRGREAVNHESGMDVSFIQSTILDKGLGLGKRGRQGGGGEAIKIMAWSNLLQQLRPKKWKKN